MFRPLTRVMANTVPTDYERVVDWYSICKFSCQTHYDLIKITGSLRRESKTVKKKIIEICKNSISVSTNRRAGVTVMQLIFNLFRFHMSDAQINQNICARNFLLPLFIFSVRRHRNHDDCEWDVCVKRRILNATRFCFGFFVLAAELPPHSSIVSHWSAVFCRQQFRVRHTHSTARDQNVYIKQLAEPSVRLFSFPSACAPLRFYSDICVDDDISALLRYNIDWTTEANASVEQVKVQHFASHFEYYLMMRHCISVAAQTRMPCVDACVCASTFCHK